MYFSVCWYPWRLVASGLHGAGVSGGYKMPSAGAGNQTLAYCKNSKYS